MENLLDMIMMIEFLKFVYMIGISFQISINYEKKRFVNRVMINSLVVLLQMLCIFWKVGDYEGLIGQKFFLKG